MRNNNKLSAPQHAFGEAVAIEAWHDPFTEDRDRADLRVDVTFRKDVPVGSEPESPVRFRLSLRRAEIAVIMPDDGSIGVDRDSVVREAPEISGHRIQKQDDNQKISGAVDVGIDFIQGISAKAKVDGEIKHSYASETELRQNLRLMMVVHSVKIDGHSWEIRPSSNPVLEGKPWKATEEPRLKIIDKRTKKNKSPSSVIIEVRCRREDLYISNIELKEDDKNKKKNFFRRNQNPNAMAAAEGYIRSCFERAGLDIDIGSMDEKFMKLILIRVHASNE